MKNFYSLYNIYICICIDFYRSNLFNISTSLLSNNFRTIKYSIDSFDFRYFPREMRIFSLLINLKNIFPRMFQLFRN